jgi:hypothetical protein
MKKLVTLLLMLAVGSICMLNALLYETTVPEYNSGYLNVALTLTNDSTQPFDYTFPQSAWHATILDGTYLDGSGLAIMLPVHIEPGSTLTDYSEFYFYAPLAEGNHTIQSAMLYGSGENPYVPVGNIVTITINYSGNANEEIVTPTMLSAYPNPFRNSLELSFKAETSGNAALSIYNLKGQLIRNYNLEIKGGVENFTWDGNDDHGRTAPSGAYIFKLCTASSSKTIKAIKLQ